MERLQARDKEDRVRITTFFNEFSTIEPGEGMSLRLFPQPRAEVEELDVAIVGAGPAGLTAALYLARYGVRTAVFAKEIGGQMAIAPFVDDYPGLPQIPGRELANKFVEHVERYGVPIIVDELVDLKREGDRWIAIFSSGRRVRCYAVILALGARKRRLGVPGEDRLVGKGVSYCAVCDGPMFAGKKVAVVGGGNSALSSALYLANLASKVYLVHRREEFRAFPHYVRLVESNPKIEILRNTTVTEILGENRVVGVRIRNVVSGEERVLEVDGVFIEIGAEPPRELFERIGIEVDESGRARVGIDMSTNLPGVFVAGDAAGGPNKYLFPQIVTAAAEGAIAADAAWRYLQRVRSGK